jgi:hypothetical protein
MQQGQQFETLQTPSLCCWMHFSSNAMAFIMPNDACRMHVVYVHASVPKQEHNLNLLHPLLLLVH